MSSRGQPARSKHGIKAYHGSPEEELAEAININGWHVLAEAMNRPKKIKFHRPTEIEFQLAEETDVLSLRTELGIMRAYLRAYVQEALRIQARGPGRPKSKGAPYSQINRLIGNIVYEMSCLFHRDPAAKTKTDKEIARLLKTSKHCRCKLPSEETVRIRIGNAFKSLDHRVPGLNYRERRTRAIELMARIGARGIAIDGSDVRLVL